MTERTGTQLISRTCRILRSFSSLNPELSLAEIAKKSQLHPATVHRILQALVDEGFLVKDLHSTRYSLGYGLVSIGELAKQSNALLKVVRQFAKELEQITCEYVAIEVLNRDLQVDTLDFIPSTFYQLSVQPTYGLSVASHCTASGKLLLAYLPESQLDMFLSNGLERFTSRTITDTEVFKKLLPAIRQEGYAVAEGELEVGFISIAAPIFGTNKKPLAAIKVGAPTLRLTEERIQFVLPELLRIATSISTVLEHKSLQFIYLK